MDDPLIKIIDNRLFQPLKEKLPAEYHEVLIKALAEVVAEMPEMEI